MSIKDQIRADIERRIKEFGKLADAAWGNDDPYSAEINEDIISELQSLIVFTYTLPEQSVEGLEEEVKRYYFEHFYFYHISGEQLTLSVLTNIARHFAEWGAAHLRDTTKTILEGGRPSFDEAQGTPIIKQKER